MNGQSRQIGQHAATSGNNILSNKSLEIVYHSFRYMYNHLRRDMTIGTHYIGIGCINYM